MANEMPNGIVLYVAVVDRRCDSFQSRRPHGDYSAFIGENRDEVIQRSLRARDDWGREAYRVLVDVLDSEAREPVRYEVVPLAASAAAPSETAR